MVGLADSHPSVGTMPFGDRSGRLSRRHDGRVGCSASRAACSIVGRVILWRSAADREALACLSGACLGCWTRRRMGQTPPTVGGALVLVGGHLLVGTLGAIDRHRVAAAQNWDGKAAPPDWSLPAVSFWAMGFPQTTSWGAPIPEGPSRSGLGSFVLASLTFPGRVGGG